MSRILWNPVPRTLFPSQSGNSDERWHRPCFVILLLAVLLTGHSETWCHAEERDEPPQSQYVQRMMSLDRNRDGFLAKAELPGKLAELLSHDSNSDGRLEPDELRAIERKAIAARDHGSRSQKSTTGRRGRGQGRRPRPGTGQGSPLDVNQIMRFALTFDADGDGGLSPAELKRYADALAVRRAAARKSREQTDESAVPEQPDRTKGTEKPKGLSDPDKDDDPFGSGGEF